MNGRAPSPILVVEVGGTTLRAACFDPATRTLLRRQTMPTPNHLGGEAHHVQVLEAMRDAATRALGGQAPSAVAVAYPGPLDSTGRVLAAPTVLGAVAEPLALQIACEELWPRARVHTMNDVTAAGYRYVAAGERDFAVVTVGSGVGHKLFLDGRPRVGPAGRGGEIGHLRLDFSSDAPPCECGGRGHLGGLASGRATVAAARRAAAAEPERYAASFLARAATSASDVDGVALAAAFHADDPFTVDVVRGCVRYLGQALAAIHVDSGVELFILVGGLAIALGDAYRRLVVTACAEACWEIGQDWDSMVRLGETDDASGLIGGGLLAAGLVGSGVG
jgi:C7-cyclitol 7-kinase